MGNAAAHLGSLPTTRRRRRQIGPRGKRFGALGAACLLLVFSPWILVWLTWHYASRLVLCLNIRRSWGNRRALVLYSDSPIWRSYFEAEILPRLQEHAVILNWSDRRSWEKASLPVRALMHFAGEQAKPPLVLVFRPLFFPRSFRYRRAFKDFKHGNPLIVERTNRDLYAALGI